LLNLIKSCKDINRHQHDIAKAIYARVFGNDQAVLLEIAKNLANFKDPIAQQTIGQAIRAGVFDTDQTVLLEIAKNLANYKDPMAQQTIGQAIRAGVFGNDQAVQDQLNQSAKQSTTP
jgi:hypothetical protein